MKKLFLLIVVMLLLTVPAMADKDYVITKNELPIKARQFVDKHFASSKISYVKLERDLFERNYEIFFADGSKVEFARSGDWRKVDCRYTEVPVDVIPADIQSYIKTNFPETKVQIIECERSDYEVKLSNKLELTFDKKFKIKNIDD